jgi:ubiquinone/menaquinone biosynthesis C-methylase UbiE
VPSIGFDRAADYYDSTRGYAPGVAEGIRDAVVAYTGATKDTRFLELGVGTGRIALPFIQAGYDYTGVDISRPMMEQLERKLAADPNAPGYHYRLLEADITQLPFADGSFDVALAVHVLHLVDGWQQALREASRALRRPGGQLLVAHDEAVHEGESAQSLVRARWVAILRDVGREWRAALPGISEMNRMRSDATIQAYLDELGATTERVTLLVHENVPLSPRAMVERHRARMYSADWLLPDAVHAEAIRRLDAWLETDCPDPDRERASTGQFVAVAAKW